MEWALEAFEIRWLTTWCPDGRMSDKLLRDLAKMLQMPVEVLSGIKGLSWDETKSKLNGIAWLEHLVLDRPFLWLEDDYGFSDRERALLGQFGVLSAYHHCNVSRNPESLIQVAANIRSMMPHELPIPTLPAEPQIPLRR